MPPYPGEERLVTVFADLHYYFTQPTVHPDTHRFDKASYFYIYYNSTRHTSRIEVANHPGTPDQDAFNGHTDSCHIQNSESFPTRLTITVDAVKPRSPSSPVSRRDSEEWMLSVGDVKIARRIHTIDVYFWAVDDAQLVTACFRRLLKPQQLDIAAFPQEVNHPESIMQATHNDEAPAPMSPVVQKLENIAVTDRYAHRSQAKSTGGAVSQTEMTIPQVLTSEAIGSTSKLNKDSSSRRDTTAANFTPMAYNPAAPAAPEPIRHRDKTPPPDDDDVEGTGLGAAMRSTNDNSTQFHDLATVTSATHQSISLPPPPPTTNHHPEPPSSLQNSYQDAHSSTTSDRSRFAPTSPIAHQVPYHSTAAEHYVPEPPYTQPVETPGAQFYSTLLQSSGRPLQHVQPQYADYLAAGSVSQQKMASPITAPIGGYSSYDYSTAQQRPHNEYDVHNQVYRPTEAESNPHAHRKSHKSTHDKGRPDSGLDRIDKGVGRLFKKLEKKIG